MSDITTNQDDIERILEEAEIDFEVTSDNGITSIVELENGVRFHFDDWGKLTEVEKLQAEKI